VVGYLVARHWRLPDQTCDAIRHHHDVDQLDAHAGRELIAILQVAMHMYYSELRVVDPEWPRHKAAVMRLLDIPADTEADYIDDLIECYNDIQRIQEG
jgi:HD-like signal output (HDOD) protein